jgi:PilZ domain
MSAPDPDHPAKSAEPDADERRARVRHATNQTTLCQKSSAQTDDIWLLGKILDLSTSGVRLLINHPFDLGAIISVEPTKVTREYTHVPQARVVYCRRQPSGGWVLGCNFLTVLSIGELEALL